MSRGPMEPGTKVSLFSLFKHHLRDWIWIVIMACLEIVVYVVIPPFHRFIGESNISNYVYPSESATVPTWSVLVGSPYLPDHVINMTDCWIFNKIVMSWSPT